MDIRASNGSKNFTLYGDAEFDEWAKGFIGLDAAPEFGLIYVSKQGRLRLNKASAEGIKQAATRAFDDFPKFSKTSFAATINASGVIVLDTKSVELKPLKERGGYERTFKGRNFDEKLPRPETNQVAIIPPATLTVSLLTKNGERSGNAIIVSYDELHDHYAVETDFGNKMNLNRREIDEMFLIGRPMSYERWAADRKKKILGD